MDMKKATLLSLVNLLAPSILAFPSYGASTGSFFDQSFDLPSVLMSPTCEIRTPIYLVDDEGHGTSHSQALDFQLSQIALGSQKLVHIVEGVVFDDSMVEGQYFGWENPEMYSISQMATSSSFLYGVLNGRYQGIPRDSQMSFAANYFRGAIQYNPGVLMSMDQEVLRSRMEMKGVILQFATELLRKLQSLARNGVNHQANDYIKSLLLEDPINQLLIQKIAVAWLEIALSEINRTERFPYNLEPWTPETVIQFGREIEAAKIIQDQYCRFSNLGKPIFIVMGSNHISNLEYLLKREFPSEMILKLSASNYLETQKDWLIQFKLSDAFMSLQEKLKENELGFRIQSLHLIDDLVAHLVVDPIDSIATLDREMLRELNKILGKSGLIAVETRAPNIFMLTDDPRS